MKFSTSFTALVAAASAASTTGFAPSTTTNINSRSTTPSALNVLPPAMEWKSFYTNFDNDAVMKTNADKDFDPLGLSDTATLFAMREAEIKHCRLAMYLTTFLWDSMVIFLSRQLTPYFLFALPVPCHNVQASGGSLARCGTL